MTKLYYAFSLLIGGLLVLASFSNNPPDGRTGAPGDGLCTDCHSSGSPAQDGEVEVTGFPDIIAPNTTYAITVTVRNPNGLADKAGFQMTILDGANEGSGTMSNPGSDASISETSGRMYFEHNPAVDFPGSNEISWTVDWTAPDGPLESPVFYYAVGNVANGNGQNSGDLVITSTGDGVISETSSVKEPIVQHMKVFPNPVSDFLKIDTDGQPIEEIFIFQANGYLLHHSMQYNSQQIDVSTYPPGMYLLRAVVGDQVETVKWVKG